MLLPDLVMYLFAPYLRDSDRTTVCSPVPARRTGASLVFYDAGEDLSSSRYSGLIEIQEFQKLWRIGAASFGPLDGSNRHRSTQ